GFAAHVRQREKTGGHENRAERHHPAPAADVDHTAHRVRDKAHSEQRDGEAEEDEAAAPPRVPADRTREDAEAVVARSPGGDLRDAEREHRAHHGITESRAPSGALFRAQCGVHEATPVTTTVSEPSQTR